MATTIVANLQLNTTAAQRQLAQFNQKISRGLGQPLGRITGDAAEFQKSLSAAAARVSAFGAVTGVLVGVSRAISGAAQATVQINKDLVELNTFLGQSTTEVNKFGREIFQVARKTASDFKTVAEAAKEFARQGLSTEETLKRTNSALILSRISGLGFAEAVTSITTAINTFNKSAIDSTQIVDKLIAVDTRFAVSSNQIAQALSRVGSSAEESGLSLDQLIATVTAVQQITGRGGSVIGNSLKTIFTRIRRPEVIEQLQSIGVTVKDQNGALLDGITVLQNYANATKNLSQVEKSRTAELLGGVFQINQLQAIIRDLTSANSIYASSLKISENASDDAIKKNEQLNQSYSALFSRTRANLTELGGGLGKDLFGPLFVNGAETINRFANYLKNDESVPSALSDTLVKASGSTGQKVAQAIVTKMGTVLGSAGPALAGVLGAALLGKVATFATKSLAGLSKSFSNQLATAAIGKQRIAEEQQILQLVQNTDVVTTQIKAGNLSISQYENLIKDSIREQNTLLANQLAIAKQLAATGVGRITAISNVPGQSRQARTAVIAPKIPGRSGGYIPAFAKEEAQARSMGAVNPKAGLINATIGGKTGPVIVNDQEKIFNVGGQTAIVPNYRSLDKVPNFASGALFRALGARLRGKPFGGAGSVTSKTSSLDDLSGVISNLINVAFIASLFSGGLGSTGQLGLGGLAGLATGASVFKRTPGGLGRRLLSGGASGISAAAPFALGSLISSSSGGFQKTKSIQDEEDRIADEFNKSTIKLQDLTETITKLDNAFKDASSTPEQLTALSKRVNDLTNQISSEGNFRLAARIRAASGPASQLELIRGAQNTAVRRRGIQDTILGFESLSEIDPETTVKFFKDLIAQLDTTDPKSLENLSNFFNKQSKDTRDILLPAFGRAFRAELQLKKLEESNAEEISKAAKDVNKKISELRASDQIITAREKSFETALSSVEQFSSLFGESAGIDFKTRASTFGANKKAKKEFFGAISASGLGGDVIERIRSIGPSEEAGALLKSEQERASAPVKKALSILIDKNSSLLVELEKSNQIAEQDAEIQRKILSIRERESFGGGIESSLSGSERAKAINAPLKGALQFRLGGMLGSRRSQIAGLTNFLSAIEEQVPGATEKSPGLRNVRERLTGLRQADLRSDLLRNARLAGGLGLGDIGSSLNILASNPSALKNIASTQAARALPGGQAPDAAIQFLNQSLNDYVSGLSQKLNESRTLKGLESERNKTLEPILESLNKSFTEITDKVKTGLDNVSNIVIANPGKVQLGTDSNQNKSGGFIPSFASPLREAINRENQYVPASSIRVNQSNKLVNSMNPMGLAVTNTIDEPNGLASIGLASGGFIPNFAGRPFNAQQQAAAYGKAEKNMLYAFDSSTGKYYKINRYGRFLSKPVSASNIPNNSQIINFNNAKYFNRLNTGLNDLGLRRLGNTLRNIPSPSFERFMTGNSPSAKAFNLAEKFQPFGQGPRQPSNLVKQIMAIGKPPSALALPPYYPNAIRLPESITSQGPLFQPAPKTASPRPQAFFSRSPGRMSLGGWGGFSIGSTGQLPGKNPIAIKRYVPLNNSPEINRLRSAFNAFGSPEYIADQKQIAADKRWYETLKKRFAQPNPSPTMRSFRPSLPTQQKLFSFSNAIPKQVFSQLTTAGSNLFSRAGSKAAGLSTLLRKGASAIVPYLGRIGILAQSGFDIMRFMDNRKTASFSDPLSLLGFSSDIAMMRYGLPGLILGTASAGYRAGNLLGEAFGLDEDNETISKLAKSIYNLDTEEEDAMAEGLAGILAMKRAKRGKRSEASIAARREQILSGRFQDTGRKVFRSRKIRNSLVRKDPLESWKQNYKSRLLELKYSEGQADKIISSILDRYALSRRYMNFSSGYIPNFAGGAVAEMMDIASSPDYSGFRNAVPQMSNYYPNVIKNSAEIEVPATEVYNRMGFFGAKPKNPAQQYAILNPAQQAALGYASEGFVPNFAMEQFASAIGDAFQKAFSPYADKMGSSSNTSNVINVSDQRSYQANTDKIEGIMEFLYKQFPKEMGKFGAVLKK